MPSRVRQSEVDIGAVRALVRIGWPIAGTARAEVRCAAAGAAAVTAGAASDSPASPPTAATGTTARAVTHANADRRGWWWRVPATNRRGVSQTGTLPGLS